MPERIHKLQPNRTLALRGFDDLGAAAALHTATASSFLVSGIFRDPADFCVLILHDADDFYEHRAIRYLPDFDFDGLTLSFDVHYSGLRPLDSPRFATIDWPYLDVIRADSSSARIPLFANASYLSGDYIPAAGAFTIVDAGLEQYDRLTLWYLNLAFDYIVPQVRCSIAFAPHGGGTVHSITVNGTVYSYTELEGDQDYTIAQRLTDAVNASAYVSAARTFGQVDLRSKSTDGAAIVITSTGASTTFTLYGVGASSVASNLAAQINGVNWNALGILMPVSATATGATLNLAAVKPGIDGNSITMYAVPKTSRLTTTAPTATLSGGVSDATWRVTLDFTALGIAQIRQAWLTFAPPVPLAAPFVDTEWKATFTNWTLSGPELTKTLQVAGPGSVVVEDNSTACIYQGAWNQEAGFYSRGYAQRCAGPGDSVLVTYHCAHTHDLYLGTSLYTDRGQVAVSLDNGTPSTLNCYLANEPAVVARRRLRSSVAAGRHTVKLTSTTGKFYFDFLQAVVASDVPDALPGRTNISPALDYSTDHTYKLSPARLLWIFDKLGFAGPMNEYIGVFWWNQRVRTGATIPSVSVTFNGTFQAGDQVFLTIGGQAIGKSVFANEDAGVIAAHFAHFINSTFVGVWAAVSSTTLTVTTHSPTAAYAFTFSTSSELVGGSTGSLSVTGSLQGGVAGEWEVDLSQSPALNRGARDWHADFFGECNARSREVVVAASMELVNPPANLPAKFHDGSPVTTSVGFGTLKSSHCAFNAAMLDYQKQVYDAIASLMSAAGVTPYIQFGEYSWWYFPYNGSMAFYDDDTAAAAAAALGRPLHVFATADDDFTVNRGADAMFLRNRLRDHVAAISAYIKGRYPSAKFEVLYPYDVNYPTPIGIHALGGRLLNFINLPVEWRSKPTSGLDTLKMEALDFGSSTRSLSLARDAMEFPINLGWPLDSIRYLIPVFNGGCPWIQEYRIAKDLRIPVINLWAFDHVNIFSLPVREPARIARAVRV